MLHNLFAWLKKCRQQTTSHTGYFCGMPNSSTFLGILTIKFNVFFLLTFQKYYSIETSETNKFRKKWEVLG